MTGNPNPGTWVLNKWFLRRSFTTHSPYQYKTSLRKSKLSLRLPWQSSTRLQKQRCLHPIPWVQTERHGTPDKIQQAKQADGFEWHGVNDLVHMYIAGFYYRLMLNLNSCEKGWLLLWMYLYCAFKGKGYIRPVCSTQVWWHKLVRLFWSVLDEECLSCSQQHFSPPIHSQPSWDNHHYQSYLVVEVPETSENLTQSFMGS